MATLARYRRVLLIGTLVLVGWGLAVGWLLRSAGDQMEAGQHELDRAREGATPASLLDPSTTDALERARGHFSSARRRLRNPLVLPLRVVPVVSRHLRSADAVLATTDGATASAMSGIERLADLSERSVGTGADRLATLDRLADLIADTSSEIGALDPGSPDALITPLAEAVQEVTEQRDDTVRTLERAEATTRALRQMLTGPTPYLLLGANNAEMRAGSGMFLSAAVIRFDQGRVGLGEVRPTQELVLPAGSVAVSDDLRNNWPWLDPGRDFRNLGLTADFPQSAEAATAMWPLVEGGEPVGGVISVDVDALRGLLRVVGPVEVDGVTYDVDTVRGELLRGQYDRFVDDPNGRDQRRDSLGVVARAVFDRVEAGGWELDVMATTIVEAVQGRHLMVWASDPQARDAFAEVSADGHLTERSLSVALLNRGANKLDPKVETSLSIETTLESDGRRSLLLTYDVVNTATGNGPRYVVGPNIDSMVAGEYRGIVVVNVPAGTTDIEMTGVRPTLAGRDGPTSVVGGELSLVPGASVRVTVSMRLGRGVDSFTLEPSARIPRTRLALEDWSPSVDRRRAIDLDEGLAAGGRDADD